MSIEEEHGAYFMNSGGEWHQPLWFKYMRNTQKRGDNRNALEIKPRAL